MAGNTIGNIFKVTTFGESHGAAIGVVIDGVPPNLHIDVNDIQKDLDRRRPGQSKVTTQRKESDIVEILSGVFESKTTGTPLAMIIRNHDHKSKDYSDLKDIFRPGHADYTFYKKYGIRDYRGGGRSSGRETAARVAAGAIAKEILKPYGVDITAYTLAIGKVYTEKVDLSVIENNIVRAPDLEAAEMMEREIKEAAKNCDSVGGIIGACVKGCPPGLGDPVFDKINARIAYALMSIGAVKGIEFGAGFEVANMKGSESNDKFVVSDGKVHTETNCSGGVNGGISSGEDIIIRLAVKPTSSIAKLQETVDTNSNPATIQIMGRHDPCICPRIVPVVEAMLAITILDCLLMQKTISD